MKQKSIALVLVAFVLANASALQSTSKLKAKLQNQAKDLEAVPSWFVTGDFFSQTLGSSGGSGGKSCSNKTDNGGGGGSADNSSCECPVPIPVPEPIPNDTCVCPTPIIPTPPAPPTPPVVPSGNTSNETNCTCDNSTVPVVPDEPIVPDEPVVPDVPDESGNTTENCTCPDNTTIPNNSGGGNETQYNCTTYKVCRHRPRCYDADWWEQYDVSCGCEKKKHYKRVCNFSDDATFDVDQFNSNASYEIGCDCAIYTNCTPIVPPPSGGEEDNSTNCTCVKNCTFTCEDVKALEDNVANLTAQVSALGDLIDGLIGTFQALAIRTASLETRMNAEEALSAGFTADIAALQVSSGSGNASIATTLSYIQQNGLYFGDDWWMGESSGVLFTMNVPSNSAYMFVSDKNVTL